MTPLIEARGIRIAHRLKPIDLSFLPGEMVAVVGANGDGKTSLLRALAQVEDVEGDVLIGGETLAGLAPNRRARLVGLLPASREMAWPICVRDVISLGGAGHSPNAVDEQLEAFELQAFADRRVDRLSTGERSRALLARIFAASPRLMLLDEPMANLDPYWVRRLLVLLRNRVGSEGSVGLVALHDLGQMARFDRVIAVRNGLVAFDGTPQMLLESEIFLEVFRIPAEALGLTSTR